MLQVSCWPPSSRKRASGFSGSLNFASSKFPLFFFSLVELFGQLYPACSTSNLFRVMRGSRNTSYCALCTRTTDEKNGRERQIPAEMHLSAFNGFVSFSETQLRFHAVDFLTEGLTSLIQSKVRGKPKISAISQSQIW